MSTSSAFFKFILPAKGEFAGVWDGPVNANFIAIDKLLMNIYQNNAAAIAPTELPNGSLWWNTISNIMFVKSKGVYTRLLSHTHDDIDLPKIDLSKHTVGILPSNMIDSVGLNAFYLGGLTKDQFFYKAGDGLDKSGPIVSLKQIYDPQDLRTFNNVNVDLFGRVVSGAQIPVTDHAHQEYAHIEGDSSRAFSVSNPSLPSHAIPLSYVTNNFHPLKGTNQLVFKVLNASSSDDAVNLGQAQALFALRSHTHEYSLSSHLHTGVYSVFNHSHPEFDGLLNITGSLNITYAKIKGSINQTFMAAEAVDPSEVPTLSQSKNLFSEKLHTHDNYSTVTHTHDDKYSGISHSHSNYSETTHAHTGVYSDFVHKHDGTYSSVTHTHANYSQTTHEHDAIYSKWNHNHAGVYSDYYHRHDTDYARTGTIEQHNHDELYLKLSGGTVVGTISCVSAPTLGGHLVNKDYVSGVVSTLINNDTLSSNYAKKNGDSNNTFDVMASTSISSAVNLQQANSLFSKIDHVHNEFMGQLVSSTIYNGVLTASVNSFTFVPKYLTISGDGVNLDLVASEGTPFSVAIANGIGTFGYESKYLVFTSNRTNVLESTVTFRKNYIFLRTDMSGNFFSTSEYPLKITDNEIPQADGIGQFLYNVRANKTYRWDGYTWISGVNAVALGEFDCAANRVITNLKLYDVGLSGNIIVSDPLGETSAVPKKYLTTNFYLKTESDDLFYKKEDVYTKAETDANYYYKVDTYTKNECITKFQQYVAPAAAIPSASASVAAPTKAEFDSLVTKLNSALAALKTHGIIS